MFGRGNWAVFGVNTDSLPKFKKNLNDAVILFGVSQLAASAKTKFDQQPSFGINGFSHPRQDEGADISLLRTIHELVSRTPEAQAEEPMDYSVVEGFYGDQPGAFQFQSGRDYYGLWVVFNSLEDVDDMASKREDVAYASVDKPYKLLNKEEKKGVELQVKAKNVLTRKQFPVLIDFQSGFGYALTTNVDDVGTVRQILDLLGAETFSVCWKFGAYDWTTQFLNKVNKDSKFKDEMKARAEELTRFKAEEVEPNDDKNIEKIVSTFFAIAELETGHWAGLKPGAKIRLHKASDFVTVADPSTAFTILGLSDDTQVAAASVVMQSLESYFTKKNEEKQRRMDLVHIDINDGVNLLDAGCALLKGFDLPQFKYQIKTRIKAGESLSVENYWEVWLMMMREAVATFIDNVAITLGMEAKTCGIQPFGAQVEETEVAAAQGE